MGEINMTPLIDVMLVLVVILLITAPLMVSAVKVDLPKASGAAAIRDAPQFITVTLDRSGQIHVNDRALDLQGASAALRQAAQRSPNTEVRLRADAAVPYGRVVEIMGQAHEAGLHRIGFVTDSAATGR